MKMVTTFTLIMTKPKVTFYLIECCGLNKVRLLTWQLSSTQSLTDSAKSEPQKLIAKETGCSRGAESKQGNEKLSGGKNFAQANGITAALKGL